MEKIIFFVEKKEIIDYLNVILSNQIKKLAYFVCDIEAFMEIYTDKSLVICNSEAIYKKMTYEGYSITFWEYEPGNRCLSASYVIQNIDELEVKDYEYFYNRLNKLPCEILRTNRLIIRETTVADVDEFLNLYADPAITMYMEDLFEPDEEREYQRNYIKNVYEFYDIGIWSVILKNSENIGERIIGRIGIEMTQEEGVVEMGYMLGTAYQHNGYAIEAARAIVQYANSLPGVNVIRAKMHIDNQASIRLCQKLGMKRVENSEDKDMMVFEIGLRKEK